MRRAIMAATLAAATAGHAQDYRAGDIVVDHPTIPETTPVARTAAGYLRLANRGDAADTLVAVEADFPSVTLHRSVESDGVARMEAMSDGIGIGPGETVILERGGLHLMLTGLAGPLEAGDEVAATLIFERAGPLDVIFRVDAPEGVKGTDHGEMDMGGMDHGEGMDAGAPSN